MKRAILFTLLMISAMPALSIAGPDRYAGDVAVFGASSAQVNPNVLFILDNSGSMDDTINAGALYSSGSTYPQSSACGGQPCQSNTVYKCTAFGLECGNWTATVTDVSSVTTSCGGSNPQSNLLTTGQWNSSRRRLTTSGGCASGSGIYALGNWINWREQVGPARPKIDVAKEVITNVINSTAGVNFGVMIFNNNQGGRLLSYNGYTASVKDMDAIFSGSTTNRQALVAAVNSVSASSWTPLAETLFEAMRYYQGGASAFNTGTYTSPITAGCQKNYVVLVTDGMSTQDNDNVLRTICNNGDCDGDGFEPANDPDKSYPNQGTDYLDDVAKYMHDHDMSSTLQGSQGVSTFTVGFGLGGANAGAVKLLNETAQNGGGQAFLSNNQNQLADALSQILGQIFEVNTSFVAPVVPVSQENRIYSGSRLYMGLFKPISDKPWQGNIKKLAIDNAGVIVDKNGDPAQNSDGSIKNTAASFWGNSTGDGAIVDSGGVGALLSPNSRNIYTYTGTSASLTHSSNAFTDGNAAITYSALDTADATEKNKLVNFVRGVDSYDDDGNGNSAETRSWMLGDVLHSRPLVVNYASYAFNTTNEADCRMNKALIFVGANDGMLHAFKDCDGSEAWAFIPPDLLPNLKYLRESSHAYFVDSTAVPYIYDANGNGAIESGDKVIIMFGERRGGGKNSAPTGGSYYALDVTDPAAPVLLFRISDTLKQKGTTSTATTDYSELGETWSEPKLVKVKIGTTPKIAAFIGAGYDNLNEDSRYGATQTFTGSGIVDISDTGAGTVTSSGTSSPVNPKGRGIYAVEIASLDSSGVPSFTGSGDKLWGYTYSDNSNMAFSIPGEVAAIDADRNGYADTIYAGDTGGNIWKFSVGDTSTSNWSAIRIFSANPSSGSTAGKKIFYKPSVTGETGYYMLFFGTGDREHPLNRNVIDRMYAIKDSGQTTTKTESDLANVTDNRLQAADATSTEIRTILNALNSSSGWHVNLDQNSGEKVLSPATVFNKSVYFTTFMPITSAASDPCSPGNLGEAGEYLMNYKTGEAVVNFYAGNDGDGNSNRRSADSSGKRLDRNDRRMRTGTGIPSGVIIIVGQGGEARLIMSVGDPTANDGDSGAALVDGGKQNYKYVKPLYWRQR